MDIIEIRRSVNVLEREKEERKGQLDDRLLFNDVVPVAQAPSDVIL